MLVSWEYFAVIAKKCVKFGWFWFCVLQFYEAFSDFKIWKMDKNRYIFTGSKLPVFNRTLRKGKKVVQLIVKIFLLCTEVVEN